MKFAIPLFVFAAVNLILSVYFDQQARELAREAFDARQAVCIGLFVRSLHLSLSGLLFVFIATLFLLRRKPAEKQ